MPYPTSDPERSRSLPAGPSSQKISFNSPRTPQRLRNADISRSTPSRPPTEAVRGDNPTMQAAIIGGSQKAVISGGNFKIITPVVNFHDHRDNVAPPDNHRSTVAVPDSEETNGDILNTATPGPPRNPEYDIYFNELLVKGRGTPLWEPGPHLTSPPEYRRKGVSLGDVGILYRMGDFDFLFNIFLDVEDDINIGAPDGFIPFDKSKSKIEQTIKKSVVYGPGSSLATSLDVERNDSLDFAFLTTGSKGAVLTMPDGALSEDLRGVKLLFKYISDNAKSWYEYFGNDCGMPIEDGDIRLVIGMDKVSSWGMATFENVDVKEPLRFEFKSDDGRGSQTPTYRWDRIVAGRVGPQDEEIRDLLQEPNTSPLRNQSVFVRTLNISAAGKLLDELAVNKVRVLRDSISDSSRHQTQSVQRDGGFRGQTQSGQGNGGSRDQAQSGQRNENLQVSQIRLPVSHPSKLLNKYLLEKCPNAEIVITKDSDWISVITENDATTPSFEHICARVLASHIIVETEGVVTLEKRDNILGPGPISDPNLITIPEHQQTTSEDAETFLKTSDDRSPTVVPQKRSHISDLSLSLGSDLDKNKKLKRHVTRRGWGMYTISCDICRRRKKKCGGEPGSVCGPCQNSGRRLKCNWDSYFAQRNRGENLDVDPSKQTDAFHNLLIQYHSYSCKLKAVLDHYVQTYSLPPYNEFRLEQPKDPDDLLGLSFSLGEFHLDKEDDDTVVGDGTENPTNILSWQSHTTVFHLDKEEEDTIVGDDTENLTKNLFWHDQMTILEGCYGISSPFRFKSSSLPVPSRFPSIAEHPDPTYTLMVGADTHYNYPFDWSRYLPSAVALDRGSHDRALHTLFLYYTPFCLRIIPDLFLKDMYRVLSVSRTHEPPKTAHYSAMLHNAIVALALAFSDDPHFRDLKARQYFIDAAKNYMEPECQKPTLAVVQALSFLATFYGSQGDQGLGFMYFGLSARVALALGLNLDCSELVERGLMERSDLVDRNWATWNIFTSDVCWSLYLGREFATSWPNDDFPLPYIDVAFDETPVAYGNLDPQPNHTTKTFHANAELFIIGRDILEVNKSLSKTLKARPIFVFYRVDYVDTKLNDWRASLPSELQLTQKSRSTATPHKLLLDLSYWWLLVLLHRPLFHYRSSVEAARQIDHVKLCHRAADNIMEDLKTWHDLFGLRFCPFTLIQIAFSAGTVYLLLALQACSGIRVAKRMLDHAIAQLALVTEYLHEIGRSWPAANKIVEILKGLVQAKLAPLLDKIPVRDDKH